MKITKSKLKQLIKEELQSLMEMPTGTDRVRDQRAMRGLGASGRRGMYRSTGEKKERRDLANVRHLIGLEQGLRLKLPLVNYAELPQYRFEDYKDLYEMAKELDKFYRDAANFEENPEDYPELRDRFNARLKEFEEESEEKLKLYAKRMGYSFGQFAPEEYLLAKTDED